LHPTAHTFLFTKNLWLCLFHRYDAFIFIGAMGICVRTIAPHVKDKHTDPAVICVDSTGRYAVSVLSGHIGKANEMTENIAHILGAEPVITTQSDRTGLWALDTLGDKFDWTAIP
jgi:cobalamin biosynthesis protein CbiG